MLRNRPSARRNTVSRMPSLPFAQVNITLRPSPSSLSLSNSFNAVLALPDVSHISNYHLKYVSVTRKEFRRRINLPSIRPLNWKVIGKLMSLLFQTHRRTHIQPNNPPVPYLYSAKLKGRKCNRKFQQGNLTGWLLDVIWNTAR